MKSKKKNWYKTRVFKSRGPIPCFLGGKNPKEGVLSAATKGRAVAFDLEASNQRLKEAWAELDAIYASSTTGREINEKIWGSSMYSKD